MELNELVVNIINIAVIPILGALSAFIIALLKAKTSNIKSEELQNMTYFYIDHLDKILYSSVKAIDQTYVANLKAENIFDKDAQKEALGRAKQAVLTNLSAEAQVVLENVYGDLNNVIENKVEALINNLNKNN